MASPSPSRHLQILAHVALAGLATPALLLYLITGVLYTYSIKGEYQTQKWSLGPLLDPNTPPDLATLEAQAEAALGERGIAAPSGASRVRRVGTSWEFEWTGASHDVILAPTASSELELAYKRTDPLRHLVQLHKAKGGDPFRWLAALMTAATLGVLLLGYLVAFQAPRYRRAAILSTLAGLFLTAVAAILS